MYFRKKIFQIKVLKFEKDHQNSHLDFGFGIHFGSKAQGDFFSIKTCFIANSYSIRNFVLGVFLLNSLQSHLKFLFWNIANEGKTSGRSNQWRIQNLHSSSNGPLQTLSLYLKYFFFKNALFSYSKYRNRLLSMLIDYKFCHSAELSMINP